MLNISVVIPTYNRVETLKICLEKILSCSPLPSEIIIHIDAGDNNTHVMLEEKNFPLTSWITSEKTQGPGGGRNKLIKEARFPLVASFDDDSCPIDPNYFQIAAQLFAAHPQAAVLSAQEIRPNTTPKDSNTTIKSISCFQNCACLIRREAFLQPKAMFRFAMPMVWKKQMSHCNF